MRLVYSSPLNTRAKFEIANRHRQSVEAEAIEKSGQDNFRYYKEAIGAYHKANR